MTATMRQRKRSGLDLNALKPDFADADEFTFGLHPLVADESTGVAREYSCDVLGRLVSGTALAGSVPSVSYSYDEEGNVGGVGQ